MAVAVKFLRHLLAVAVVVAVIVGLGMAWAHVSGGGPGARFGQAPPAQALQRLKHLKGGVVTTLPGRGSYHQGLSLTTFDLADDSDLIRTCLVEAVLATAVITVSAARLRRRRARRAAARP